MNHDVFISYSRKDSEIVNQICALLKENDIKFWIDKDGIYSGGRFKEVIVDAIETTKVVLFVSSENSNRSPNVVKEINIAALNDKIIVPLKLDEASYDQSISYDISSIDHIEYSAIDFNQRLVKSLKGAIEKSKL
jgi:hypothetical protein